MRHLASLVLALAVASPAGAMVITTLDPGPLPDGGSAVAYGPNGLAVISYVTSLPDHLKVAACQDVACSSAIITILDGGSDVLLSDTTGIAFGADGRAVISYARRDLSGPSEIRVAHCENPDCTTATFGVIPGAGGSTAIAVGSDSRPIVAFGDGANLKVAHCADAGCTSSTVTVFPNRVGATPTITIGGDGRAVVACGTTSLPLTIHLGHCTDVACSAATFVPIPPGPSPVGNQRLPSLATRPDGVVAMAYEYEFGTFPNIQTTSRLVGCVDAACTAVADLPGGYGGRFFDPALAFMPGDRPLIAHKNGTLSFAGLSVTLCPDAACASSPQLTVDQTTAYAPSAAVAPSGVGLVVYHTGDLKVAYLSPADISIGDAARLEGNGGTAEVELEVRASEPADAVVHFSTAAGTATNGVDYLPASGVLTFTSTAGDLSRIVRVPIVGDTSVEGNEAFVVNLQLSQGATLGDGQATVTIVDDDVSAAGVEGELAPGGTLLGDLAAAGGLADVDLLRIDQASRASYEVVVDALSGDLGPIVLTRTSADGTAVLQASSPVGTGTSASLRWRNGDAPVANQLIRVASGGCQTDCGVDDVYRLRAYETTVRGARFNQSGSQSTVVLLQNAGNVAVDVTVDFWSDAGALLASTSVSPLAPRGLAAIAAGGLPALVGKSGSLTVSHTGSYGSLVGKAVALEPATGASFDTPLEPRPK